MRLTTESNRVRWWGLVLTMAIVAVVLYLHAAYYRDYVGILDQVGLRGQKAASTPMSRICPTMYADAEMWVRHALALAGGWGPQMRFTHVDNAPFGREVHWSSGFAWAIAGAGWVRHALFGEPLAKGIEQSLAWFNLPLLLGIVLLFSAWVSRRAGLGAGVILAFAMLSNPDFYSGFSPNYVDHHGILAAAVLGLLLGATFMGVGFVRADGSATQLLPKSVEAAKAGAILSAICGAVGMWFSAATLIPGITIVGVAGALTILVAGKSSACLGVKMAPNLWRCWGRVGAAISLAFYLLEYAPFHLGFRLEVNHPFYAAGWWGGSELIAQLAELRQGGSRVAPFRWRSLVLALMGIAVAPVTIALAGPRVFVVFDPFISHLSTYVAEGLSVPKAIRILGWERIWMQAPWFIAAVGLGAVMAVRSAREDRPLVVFGALSFAGFAAMAFAQLRWQPSASAAEICLTLLALVALGGGRSPKLAWCVVALFVGLMAGPALVKRVALPRAALSNRAVERPDAMQPIYRDIAAALRAAYPEGDITLLASPNASVAISYYGQFKSVGTLYWENLAGTKAAAKIFSAQGEVEARKLIRERKITHIAMVSEDNFLTEYFDLQDPQHLHGKLEKSFGFQLLAQQQIPIWLESIPYEMPTDAPLRPERVLLFATHFNEPAAEATYESALQEIEAGHLNTAELKLDQALTLAPQSAEFWLIKGHVLLARGEPAGALTASIAAIERASPQRRFALAFAEGNRFYEQHAHAGAVELYRRALAERDDTLAANNLAWVLATSSEEGVRNGELALRITERLVQQAADYTHLTANAAALAEVGRFDDAVTAAVRALDLAQASGGETLITKARQRLLRYRAGKPWRE